MRIIVPVDRRGDEECWSEEILLNLQVFLGKLKNYHALFALCVLDWNAKKSLNYGITLGRCRKELFFFLKVENEIFEILLCQSSKKNIEMILDSRKTPKKLNEI